MLDPRISYETLRQEFADDSDTMAHINSCKEHLEQHYRQYYQPHDSLGGAASQAMASGSTLVSGSPMKDYTARYKNRKRNTSTDEFVDYFSQPSVDWDCDPIWWWAERKNQFPNLSKLARDIMSIPGMQLIYVNPITHLIFLRLSCCC